MADQRLTAIEKGGARQGVTRHKVRYVLIVSLALVVISFLAVATLVRS
jgi:hypothetical protein